MPARHPVGWARPVLVGMRALTAVDPYYHVDWDRVRSAVTERIRAIMFNSPHNSTDTVFTVSNLGKLEKIMDNTSIDIILDEVYEHIAFYGASHLSLATRLALAMPAPTTA